MSRFDYEEGRRIASSGPSFYALIQAAMRGADSENGHLLRNAWPEVYEELQRRYEAPGGRLPEDDQVPT